MSTSDTGTANRSIVLESDVVVLKEIFPDTAEVDIKRALEMGSGSRDKTAASLMNWETPDYQKEEKVMRNHNDEHAETSKTELPSSAASSPTGSSSIGEMRFGC